MVTSVAEPSNKVKRSIFRPYFFDTGNLFNRPLTLLQPSICLPYSSSVTWRDSLLDHFRPFALVYLPSSHPTNPESNTYNIHVRRHASFVTGREDVGSWSCNWEHERVYERRVAAGKK